MDLDVFQKEIKRELQGVDSVQLVQFASYCALRALPFLGAGGHFNYWGNRKQEHLLSVFRVHDLLSDAAAARAAAADARAAAADARAAVYAAARAAAYADAAADAAAYAAAYAARADARAARADARAAADAAAAARTAAAAARALNKDNFHSFLEAIRKDLQNIKSNTAIEVDPEIYGEVLPRFLSALESIECHYWVKLYKELFYNNFQFNKAALERRLKVLKEIQDLGAAEVGKYLEALEQKGATRLNEARIIILGDKGSGKTSLARKLIDPNAPMPEIQESTPGVDTLFWKIENKEDSIQARIWDFAGHTVTHAAHQFFLSERCLYILVYDGRTDRQDRLDYWLQHMENYGGEESKAIILVNKRDQHAVKLKENYLKKNYPIKDIYYFSIQDDPVDLEQFRTKVSEYLIHNPSWKKQQIPTNYYQVKEELERLFQEASKDDCIDFIEKEEFEAIARKNEIEDSSNLLNALHQLGISLWYQHMVQYNTLVLNPEWITFGVYRLINWAANQDQFDLSIDDFERVFEQEKARYPGKKSHQFLFDLMKHYELAYQTDGRQQLIIPHLLKEDLPDGLPAFSVQESLRVRYKADQPLLPNTISRFIVRHHKEIKDPKWLWRYGVILEDGRGSTALVEEQDRTITATVIGAQKTEFITAIRGTLNDIFKDYKVKRPELEYKIERNFGKHSEMAAHNISNELWKSETEILSHAAENEPILDPITRQRIPAGPIVLQYQMTVNVFSEQEAFRVIQDMNRKVESILQHTLHIQSQLTDIGIILLQEITNLQTDLFDNRVEERRFFAKLEDYIFSLPKEAQPKETDWFDQEPKRKLKLTIPLLLAHYEQEYDLSKTKLPRTWAEFKTWFVKEVP